MKRLFALLVLAVAIVARPSFAQSPQSYTFAFPDVAVCDGTETGAPVTIPMVMPPAPSWTKRVTIDFTYAGHGPISMESTSSLPRPPGNFDVGCPLSFRHGTMQTPFDGSGYTYIYNYPALAPYDGVCDGAGPSGDSWVVNGLHAVRREYTSAFDLALWRRFDRGGAHWLFVRAFPEVMSWPSTTGHGWFKSGHVVFSYPNGFTITFWPTAV